MATLVGGLNMARQAGPPRRYKVFLVDVAVFLDMLKAMCRGDRVLVASGMPQDASVLGFSTASWLDGRNQHCVRVLVTSESFPEVEENVTPAEELHVRLTAVQLAMGDPLYRASERGPSEWLNTLPRGITLTGVVPERP